MMERRTDFLGTGFVTVMTVTLAVISAACDSDRGQRGADRSGSRLTSEADTGFVSGGQKPLPLAVLVLDASESMQESDPQNFRNRAAAMFARQAYFYLLDSGRDPMLGLVRFGKRANIVRASGSDSDLTTLSDTAAVSSLRAALPSIGRKGQRTDILKGLRRSRELIRTVERQSQRPVAPVVLLLSDGVLNPDPEDVSLYGDLAVRHRAAGSEVEREGIEDEVRAASRRKLSSLLGTFAAESWPLYPVALGEEADRELLKWIAGEAQPAGGTLRFFGAEAGPDLVRGFSRVLRDWLDLAWQSGSAVDTTVRIPVDATVGAMTVSVASEVGGQEPEDLETMFEVVTPSDRAMPEDLPRQTVRTPGFYSATLPSPSPGTWKLRFSGVPAGHRLRYTVLLRSDVQLRVETPYEQVGIFDAREPVRAALVDRADGSVLDPTQAFRKLRVTASTRADTVILVDDGSGPDRKSGDGVFASRLEPLLDDVGVHEITFRATGELPDGGAIRPKSRKVAIEVLGGVRFEPSGGQRLDFGDVDPATDDAGGS